MLQQEIITAIDLGSKKFSASVVQKGQNDELEILMTKSFKSQGIEKGILNDVDKCKKSVVNLLEELEKKLTKNIKYVTIGISSRKLRISERNIRFNTLNGKVTNEEIIEAIDRCKKDENLSNDEVIADILINFYVIDGRLSDKDIINWIGNNVEINVTLVIGQKDEINKYKELFKGTKYELKNIKSNILCGKQIFLSEKDKEGDIALVDIGAGKVDIGIFSKSYVPINIASIPVGGNNISNDLAICGGFSFMEADNIKKIYSSNYKTLYCDHDIPDEIEVGTIKISKELFYEVTYARIEEIMNQINNELKKTGHYDRICSIILYGDGVSYFEDINEIVEKIFRIRTKVVTGKDLGLKNSENITSLAIAKEVYDRLSLLGNNSKVPAETNTDEFKVNETENLHYNEDEGHLLKKIKSFFNKIF